MIDLNKITPVIDGYKRYFPDHWADGKYNEKYKWEAVKHFRDNWDKNAENFGEMFKKATEKTFNLLASGYDYPRLMIIEFAKADDNAVRNMFVNLFDEDKDLTERVETFMRVSEEIRAKYDNGTWKKHYQNTNAISTYLWLMYPDKYYIYKYELYKAVSKALDATYTPKRNGSVLNMVNGFKMYDEICGVLKNDSSITDMINNFKNDACYSDPELKTATVDFGFYLARYYQKDNTWFPALNEYDPGFSVEDWIDLLRDGEIFKENSLTVIKRFYEIGGDATCKELSNKYGEDPQYYNSTATRLAERIVKFTNCPIYNGNTPDYRYWPVLFVGKRAQNVEEGIFRWKLRDELKEALEELFYGDDSDKITRCWFVGAYSDDSDTHHDEDYIERGIWQNGYKDKFLDVVNSVRVGDKIAIKTSYIKKNGLPFDNHGKIISVMNIKIVGTVTANHNDGRTLDVDWDTSFQPKEWYFYTFRNTITLPKEDDWRAKALIDFVFYDVPQDYEKFNTSKDKDNPDVSQIFETYNKEDFLNDVFVTESEYDKLRSLILRKKNVILQGAPGVGKTFAAKRLAYSIIGEKNESHICMVQFHQNYSYEDFIMGYRPNDSGGFDLKSGVFSIFCERCKEKPEENYFFIIDEINRGNLSKIFGELLMLIETDKRGEEHKINLVYGGEFYIPDNLHIIGMMNTADRSLAMIDYALRRRFSFYTMTPAFDNADKNGFDEHIKGIDCECYHNIIAKIKALNNAIRNDSSLGKGFEIGHSYFAPEDMSIIDDEWVHNVVEFEIIPLIEEYWFDDDKNAEKCKKALYQALGEEYDG